MLFGSQNTGMPQQAQGGAPTPYIHQNPSETPRDSVQCIRFSPALPNMFAVASWDSTLRFYEISPQPLGLVQKASVAMPAIPLAFDFRPDGAEVFVVCSDQSIYQVDLNTLTPQKLISTTSQALYIRSLHQKGLIMVITEANTLEFFYPNPNSAAIFSFRLNYPVTCFDVSNDVLLVGLANNRFAFIDLNTVNNYAPNDVVYSESQLKTVISAVAVNAETGEFALGSVDGRVYKGIFSQSGPQGFNTNKVLIMSNHNTSDTSGNFVYVAHSKKRNDGTADHFNIGCMGFSRRSKNFMFTSGSDGNIHFWDVKEKNKIAYFALGTPVTSAELNASGTFIAFAIGYDWSQGVWGLPSVTYAPKIGFRAIDDSELVFKSSTTNNNAPNFPNPGNPFQNTTFNRFG